MPGPISHFKGLSLPKGLGTLPQPAPPPTPAQQPSLPAPSTTINSTGGNNVKPWQAAFTGVRNFLSKSPNEQQHDIVSAATDKSSPLGFIAQQHAPGISQVAQTLGGGLQRVSADPATFGQILGGVAPDVFKAVVSTPFGLPMLAAGYGLLRGGRALADVTHGWGQPILNRLGVNTNVFSNTNANRA